MSVSEALEFALNCGVKANEKTHERWIKIYHQLGAEYGVAMLAMAGDTRLDLLLRQLEVEILDKLRKQEKSETVSFLMDFQLKLSECWVLSSYEVIRSASQQDRKRERRNEKLKELLNIFELVRMPIAKYEIAGANRGKPHIELVAIGATSAEDTKTYAADGTYIVPRGINCDTGSVTWAPINLETGKTVEISRIELSDQFLNLFT